MNRFAKILLVFALIVPPALAQDTIRLGAWNIEHLGNPGSRGGAPAQAPRDIAEYIIASEVDVLGLEEITQNLAGRRNQTIERALEIVRQRTGDTWRHVLFPKSDIHQHIGVAWNTARAEMIGNPFRIPVATSSNGQPLWDRRPHAVQFSFGDGRSDLVVIVLHMKANRRENNGPNLQRREREARTLVQKLPQVRSRFDDEDIVLIGDSNILTADEAAAEVFGQAGFEDLNGEDEPTYNSDDGAPFDRAFVPSDQTEFENVDQVVFDEEFLGPQNMSRQQFRRRLSDHFMIVTDVQVIDDDD